MLAAVVDDARAHLDAAVGLLVVLAELPVGEAVVRLLGVFRQAGQADDDAHFRLPDEAPELFHGSLGEFRLGLARTPGLV